MSRQGSESTTCKGVGERSEWCPGGAFAKGENEVSESSETSSGLQRQQEPLRRLSLRKNPADSDSEPTVGLNIRNLNGRPKPLERALFSLSIDSLRSLFSSKNAPLGHPFLRSPPGSESLKMETENRSVSPFIFGDSNGTVSKDSRKYICSPCLFDPCEVSFL